MGLPQKVTSKMPDHVYKSVSNCNATGKVEFYLKKRYIKPLTIAVYIILSFLRVYKKVQRKMSLMVVFFLTIG